MHKHFKTCSWAVVIRRYEEFEETGDRLLVRILDRQVLDKARKEESG